MKAITVSLLGLFICVTSLASVTPEEKGVDIARKAQDFNNGFAGESSTMEMILINAHGDKITRKMESMTKEVDGDGDKSLVTFLWPADVKGTKMLTWTHKTSNDDQWLFLPALKRVKRISSRSKSGSFMGSEFSYEDLGSQEIEKYNYKYVKDEKSSGRNTWVLERVPTDKKSGYSKEIVWMDKTYQNPLKIDYFDRKGELLKTASYSEYKKLKQWWRAAKITMVNHQTKKSSVLTWSERKLGQKYSDRKFHKKNLKN